MNRYRDGGFLYSTQHGELCPACEQPVAHCSCTSEADAPGDGVIRVGRQTQGRKGKGVTVVTGVPLAGKELAQLAKALKQRCGSGGTVRDGVIELQGDHRDTVLAELESRGWKGKRSGG